MRLLFGFVAILGLLGNWRFGSWLALFRRFLRYLYDLDGLIQATVQATTAIATTGFRAVILRVAGLTVDQADGRSGTHGGVTPQGEECAGLAEVHTILPFCFRTRTPRAVTVQTPALMPAPFRHVRWPREAASAISEAWSLA